MGVLSAVRSWFGGSRQLSRPVAVRARYDAAQTTTDNENHWANADLLGAATANSEAVRSKLRTRARYERANNCFCNGMVRTVANHVIGAGPKLHVNSGDDAVNETIEHEWERWARRTCLADKLRTMRMARCCDGEAFALLTSNTGINVDVTLDVRLVECDQVRSPGLMHDPLNVEGIKFDLDGNPVGYYVLDHHPGDALEWSRNFTPRLVDARFVLHWFRKDRPGQVRGVPEITPALPLYALLRRYTLACVHSAETAANFAIILKTSGTIDPAEVEAWESLAVERNGMMTVPEGWEPSQLKAEQPTTQHGEFQKSLLREIARCLDMPFNIAAGDSSSYNYSSGKLDDQTWGRMVEIDRVQGEIDVLDRIFAAWKAEAEAFGLIPRIEMLKHSWHWPPSVDIDPVKEATAAINLRNAGLLTDREYHAKRQGDWRDVYEQRAVEMRLRRELGIEVVMEPTAEVFLTPKDSNAPAATDQQTTNGDTADTTQVQASGGPKYRFDGGQIRVNAIASEGDLPTFEMLAYTGGMLHFPQFDRPVVVDLATLRASGDVIPALRDHKLDQEIGHIPTIDNNGQQLKVAGVLSSTSEHQRRVVEAAKNGFAWQASIGADFNSSDFQPVESGRTVTVNGQLFNGPIYVARGGVLREVSFVSIGNDPGTAVNVAATYGGNSMFEEYLKTLGINPEGLTDAGRAALETQFKASAGAGVVTETETATTSTATEPVVVTATAQIDHSAARAVAKAETQRIAAIQKLAASHPSFAAQAEKAIDDGTEARDFELLVLRAARPTGPAIHVHAGHDGASLKPVVLQAAAMQALGATNLDKSFSAQDLDAAHRAFKGRMGLQELLTNCALKAGWHGAAGGFRANTREILRAAFSSTEASDILSNVANKFLLEAYSHVESAWQQIASIRSVPDFKTATSYRLIGNMDFEEVAPDGKLKHGKIADKSYTNSVDTYGRMFSITRKDLINDDLGALQNIPAQIGRGGALKLNDVFWTEFIAGDGTFWHTSHSTTGDTGNSNKTTGAFASSTLATAEALFMMQVDTNGRPIAVMPRKLLVPPALYRKALELMTSSTFVSGNTTKEPSANTFVGAYDIVTSTYLQNSSYGNSSVIYYLLADPRDLPVIEVAFLNGQQTPTVEEVEVDSDMLGMSFRGYFDFGVAKQDYRGGVKSTGA